MKIDKFGAGFCVEHEGLGDNMIVINPRDSPVILLCNECAGDLAVSLNEIVDWNEYGDEIPVIKDTDDRYMRFGL